MKSYLFLLSCIALFVGCKNDEDIAPESEVCEIVNTNGTILKNLIFINEHTPLGPNTWSFFYNISGQIDSIGPSHPQQIAKKYYYQSNKIDYLVQTQEFDSIVFQRDSFIYDDTDKISERIIYHTGSNGSLELRQSRFYHYNEVGQIIEIQNYFHPNQEITSINKYTWENNNVISSTTHSADNELYVERFYEYGSKLNVWKKIPYYIESPNFLSENNCIKTTIFDYEDTSSGCTPCTVETTSNYTYNLDDYPVEYIPLESDVSNSRRKYVYE